MPEVNWPLVGRGAELKRAQGNGEWVSPFEVESVLVGMHGVQEAAVVPSFFDGLLRPVAFVVLAPDAQV